MPFSKAFSMHFQWLTGLLDTQEEKSELQLQGGKNNMNI